MTSSSRRRVIAVAALLAAIPALAACGAGWGANTNMPYAPTEAGVLIENTGSGMSYGKNGVMVSQAFVLGPDPGQQIAAGGSAPVHLTFVSHNEGPDSLTAITADEQQAVRVNVPNPIDVQPGTLVKTPGVTVEGLVQPLRGGETLQLTLQFKNAGAIALNVPVITRSREFASLPPAPQPSASPSETPTPDETTAPSDTPSPDTTPETSDQDSSEQT
ncbi:copper chaperone PCu(A)C [Sphaerimonospora sp. CA-214678]|uniref:copper chaperone PCu(A)C n=1 Tax=Sphaerimonospora sp. CA-214678 TaxID=3240029 RepID=UPI003D8D4AA8